jgi:hypothetical protein
MFQTCKQHCPLFSSPVTFLSSKGSAPCVEQQFLKLDCIFWVSFCWMLVKKRTKPSNHTLQRQNAENLKQIFPEKEYRGLSPNFHIHVSVCELCIPTMGLPFLLEEICRPILGIYKSLPDTRMWKLGLRPRNSQKRKI